MYTNFNLFEWVISSSTYGASMVGEGGEEGGSTPRSEGGGRGGRGRAQGRSSSPAQGIEVGGAGEVEERRGSCTGEGRGRAQGRSRSAAQGRARLRRGTARAGPARSRSSASRSCAGVKELRQRRGTRRGEARAVTLSEISDAEERQCGVAHM